MSWDLDAAEARELVEAYLAAVEQPRDDIWMVVSLQERDWGWIVSWLSSRAAQGSTAQEDAYAKCGPILVDRKTARMAMCGTAHPAEYYVQAWHRGELADLGPNDDDPVPPGLPSEAG